MVRGCRRRRPVIAARSVRSSSFCRSRSISSDRTPAPPNQKRGKLSWAAKSLSLADANSFNSGTAPRDRLAGSTTSPAPAWPSKRSVCHLLRGTIFDALPSRHVAGHQLGIVVLLGRSLQFLLRLNVAGGVSSMNRDRKAKRPRRQSAAKLQPLRQQSLDTKTGCDGSDASRGIHDRLQSLCGGQARGAQGGSFHGVKFIHLGRPTQIDPFDLQTAQFAEQIAGRESAGRIFRQHLVNDAAQPSGKSGRDSSRSGCLRCCTATFNAVGPERRMPAEHVVAGDAERIDVAAGINGLPSTCSGLM